MADLERRTRNHLVLVEGFSKRNAEIALEMFKAGELNQAEEVFINRIMINPDNDEDKPHLYYPNVAERSYVGNALNLRITQSGGDATTRGRI